MAVQKWPFITWVSAPKIEKTYYWDASSIHTTTVFWLVVFLTITNETQFAFNILFINLFILQFYISVSDVLTFDNACSEVCETG